MECSARTKTDQAARRRHIRAALCQAPDAYCFLTLSHRCIHHVRDSQTSVDIVARRVRYTHKQTDARAHTDASYTRAFPRQTLPVSLHLPQRHIPSQHCQVGAISATFHARPCAYTSSQGRCVHYDCRHPSVSDSLHMPMYVACLCVAQDNGHREL